MPKLNLAGATLHPDRPLITPVKGDVLRVNPDFERQRAAAAIDEKWRALGGAPGAPTIPGLDGVIPVGEGFYREYAKGGRIYFRRRGPNPPYWVYGDILIRYLQLGGPLGWLGWPLSDEEPAPDNGRVSRFENGAIYWWDDTKALEVAQVVVRYTGLVCFSEQTGGGSDEPYVLFGVAPPPPAEALATRTIIYDDVDAGGSKADSIELFRGLPDGLVVQSTLMEHDEGDPDKYLGEIKGIVDAVVKMVAAAVTGGAAAAFGKVLEALRDVIADFVNALLGTDDEVIGLDAHAFTTKELVALAHTPLQVFRGVPFNLQSGLISGGGADYKLLFEVRRV